MPRILQMADDFAERFAFEPSRIAGIVKALREAGLLKAGPRGKNAPDATALDAARILIGMMLRLKHEDVAEGVRLFGGFKPNPGDEHASSAPATFEGALAQALKTLSAEGAREDRSRLVYIKINRDYCYGQLHVAIRADDDDPRWDGEVDFDGIDHTISVRYLHPEFDASLANQLTPTAQLLAAWRRYRSGFHEEPVLHPSDLIDIAQVLAGHDPPLEPAN